MSEADEPQTSTEKPSVLIRGFLIVLPIGLALMVPISMIVYQWRKHRPEPATVEYAAALQSDLNAREFAHYVSVFTEEIGERSLTKPEGLDRAAKYIESTMDPSNMGYAVQRQTFDAQGKGVANLVAELPGRSKPGESVLVLANYDDADAKGIAALMCIAHALTGSKHARTIRFAAVANAADLDAGANGLNQLAQSEAFRKTPPTTIVLVAPAMSSVPDPWKQAKVLPLASLLLGDPLAGLKRILGEIEKEADAP